MEEQRKVIKRAFSKSCEDSGLTRYKPSIYYLEAEETRLVLRLRKYYFSPGYTVDVQITEVERSSMSEALKGSYDVAVFPEDILQCEEHEVRRMLSDNENVDESERKHFIAEMIRSCVAFWKDFMLTKDDLHSLVLSGYPMLYVGAYIQYVRRAEID